MLEFPELLSRSLIKAGYKQLTFAKAAKTSQGFIGDLLRGRRTPPLDRLEEWAELLSLTGQGRDEFFRAAYLAHCPEPIRKEMEQLRSTIARLQRMVADLREEQ